MSASPKINSNYNNNENYDVSINIPERTLQHGREIYNEFSIPEEPVEAAVDKAFVCNDFASRKPQRQDESGKDYEDNEHCDGQDALDGRSDKTHIILEEEVVVNEELESDEADPKKVNAYAAKKTVAQGMMDIALITANANQLRYIVEFNRSSSTFFFIVTLITFSLVLQVAVGIALIFKGRLDIRGKSKDPDAKKINNYVVVAIFLVTIINVFIASFTITGDSAKLH